MDSKTAYPSEEKCGDVVDSVMSIGDHDEGSVETIYIDPAREAAARRKFDIYVVPVSVIYLVLSTLDRNNVSLISTFESLSRTQSDGC